ncbi:MAG: hypothetical protein Q8904_10355 [Bacteroidota bacterium]|nr:hypothetical protein [Bacteroidota bacterium]
MNKKFSFKRVALLLQRYFFENMNREIMFWCIITLLFTMLDHRNFVILVLFVSGIISAVRLNKELFKGPNGIHYLLIPAKHVEKLTANIFLTTVYHFVMIIISYCIGNLLVQLIYHFILKLEVPVNWDLFQVTNSLNINGVIQATNQNVFWSVLGLFAFSQALFLLGSLYFQRNAILKTILSIVVIGIVLFNIQVFLFKTMWDVKYISNAILPALVMLNDSDLPPLVDKVFLLGSYLMLPFLWTVSYFRLSEKQL